MMLAASNRQSAARVSSFIAVPTRFNCSSPVSTVSRPCTQAVTKYRAPGIETRPVRRRSVLRTGRGSMFAKLHLGSTQGRVLLAVPPSRRASPRVRPRRLFAPRTPTHPTGLTQGQALLGAAPLPPSRRASPRVRPRRLFAPRTPQPPNRPDTRSGPTKFFDASVR